MVEALQCFSQTIFFKAKKTRPAAPGPHFVGDILKHSRRLQSLESALAAVKDSTFLTVLALDNIMVLAAKTVGTRFNSVLYRNLTLTKF